MRNYINKLAGIIGKTAVKTKFYTVDVETITGYKYEAKVLAVDEHKAIETILKDRPNGLKAVVVRGY